MRKSTVSERDAQESGIGRLDWKQIETLEDCLSGGILGCYLDECFSFYFVSHKILHILDYTRETVLALYCGVLELIHPEDRKHLDALFRESLEEGESLIVEFRMLKRSGQPIWMRLNGHRSNDENGQPILLGVCMDISSEIGLRKELESLTWEYNLLADSFPCGICRVSLDNGFPLLYTNRFFRSLFGYPPEQAGFVRLKLLEELVHARDKSLLRDSVSRALENGRYHFELESRFVHITGDMLWLMIQCNLDPCESGFMTCVLIDITGRKQEEQLLRMREEENLLVIQQFNKLISRYDIAARTLFQPESLAELFGLPAVLQNVPESVLTAGILAEESKLEYKRFFDSMIMGQPNGCCVLRMRSSTGIYGWYEAKYSLIFEEEGVPLRAVISYTEITKQREKEIAYERWCQYFEALRIDSVAYYEFNLTYNQFETMEGKLSSELPCEVCTSFSAVTNYAAQNFVYYTDQEAYLKTLDRNALLERYKTGYKQIQFEHRRKVRDGEPFWALAVLQLIADPYTDAVKAFLLIKDINAEKIEALRLQQLSETDALTGLLNRRAVTKRITDLLKKNDSETSRAFIMLDLDHFKLLNDSLGHQFGDLVLKELAAALQDSLCADDFCGRLGGDEFVIFLKGADSEHIMEAKLKSVCTALCKRYNNGVEISGSLGIACYPYDGKTFGELYRKADIALYQAKQRGRNQYAYYQEEEE